MLANLAIPGLDRLKDWFVGLGPFGVLLLAFLDSFVPIPFGVDAAVVVLSSASPATAPLTVLCATVGAVAGATTLYLGARRAGEAALARIKPERRERVEHLLGRYDMLVIAGAACAPPPFPFKVFNLAAGALEVKVSRFTLAVTIGRLIRFVVWSALGVVYGEAALDIVKRHGVKVLVGAVLAGLCFWAYRTISARRTAAVGD